VSHYLGGLNHLADQVSLWFNDAGPITDNSGTATATISVTAPAKSNPPNTEKVPVDNLSPKDADKMKEAFLVQHLNANSVYYNRAVWMLMDPAERRLYLEAALGSDSPILSAIDDKPIAVSGNSVAFVYDGPLPFTQAAASEWGPLESIVTLPTRGLFAEAQLGHCNSCERRDVTRMWDWTEMTAEEPPAISGIQPGPQGQMPTLTASQLPANVVQIAPTPAAPDPIGLAAALKLLGTPEIFRDMSGLDEASTILGKLVDGTTATLTEMVKGAAAAKEKVDASRARQGASGSGQSAERQAPAERYDNLQVAKEVAQAADQLGLSDQQQADLMQDIIGTGSPSTPRGVLLDWLLQATPGAGPLSGYRTTSAKIKLVELLVKNKPNTFGTCSQGYLDRMADIVAVSNLLTAGVVAGSIFVWIPKGLEDLIFGPVHTAEGIGELVEATIAIPDIARNRLKVHAELALFQCSGLTPAEMAFWENMSRLLV
jgi:hypothetical protein